ncbi:hypothetical protein [Microbacterium amylolyticum]|uniref:SbsA Ig-like domain-containing protein n=1 Tax=Microbacterium amylolyticum TaxID=936337 RepID=A0ABS4ZJ73_9MICO|nr:hypothetical protein [Microbacterium amylolyticum]MBP2436995.1 hypothetical protein [Microbacterium amylolyticum]
MSTSRRMRRRRRGGFLLAFGAVVGGLALVSAVGTVAGLTQGPRLTDVQVDPAASIAESGSRVILRANQALTAIDPDQVTIMPETEYTLDAAGRTVGVRFPTALDADTTYSVSIGGVIGAGGGPASTLETSFTTPRASILVVERDGNGPDEIRQVEIGGDSTRVILRADSIDDFRVTSRYLIASIVEGEAMRLLVVDREAGAEGEAQRTVDVPLPGEGTVTGLQVSDRGELYGFTFTDRGISEGSGRANVLFTGSLRSAFAGDEPEAVVVGSDEPSIDRWRFVPETSSLLLNDFDGDLTLVDLTNAEADATSFGVALGIEGVARSTYTALIEHAEQGFIELDLATGESRTLDDVDLGVETTLGHILPIPQGTLRSYAEIEDNLPTRTLVVAVTGEDDQVTELAEVPQQDAVLQVCASPSAQYAAVTVAPDLPNNRYDDLVQRMPERVETRVVDVASGETVTTVPGFGASWCDVGPW